MNQHRDNRRLSDRVKVHWHAQVSWPEHGSLAGQILDVSTSGAYLQTAAEFRPGDTVNCLIDARDSHAIHQLALQFKVIRRVLLPGTQALGYGMQLLNATEVDREFLLRAITTPP